MAKSPIDIVIRPVSKFIHQEYTGGIVLFLCVLIALIWSNSEYSSSYYHIWETSLSLGFDGNLFDHELHVWINDGLMALFFFVIGLELKREFMAGELSSFKKASLPMIAALGGMLVPALIYFTFNNGLDSAVGWGIPMATDIAFALGLLSLSGNNIPSSVKVFLSALAVADDLGAVLVIAFFYTSQIEFSYLFLGGGFLVVLLAGNWLGIRHTLFYLIIGIVVWACFLFSGVHATIAGVLVAFTIPARTKINEEEYIEQIRIRTKRFEDEIPLYGPLMTSDQHAIVEEIKMVSLDAQTPLQKIEYALHPWVAYLIMPLFALANSGMTLHADFFSSLTNPVSMGVMTGLILGKLSGVFGFTWLMVKFKLAELPRNVNWQHIFGVALLAGVGFTMSLFVTNLAFSSVEHIDAAKYGILLASLVSGTGGVIFLRSVSKK